MYDHMDRMEWSVGRSEVRAQIERIRKLPVAVGCGRFIPSVLLDDKIGRWEKTVAGFMGMDPDAAKALATKMNKTAETINQAVQTLTGAVNGVQWKGTDAERFKNDWRSTGMPSAKKVAEMLRSHATKLNQEAAQQTQAST